ncbi:hypothetical protein SUGI_0685430 [Cryptomeria japonica]|nr:hypothetical protein SUGI_0685430 [Cryptomeria japonica]
MAKAKTVMAFMAMVALIGATDAEIESEYCNPLLSTGCDYMGPCANSFYQVGENPPAECCNAFAKTYCTAHCSCMCSWLQEMYFTDSLVNCTTLYQACNIDSLVSSCKADVPASPQAGSAPPSVGRLFSTSMVAMVLVTALVLMKAFN